MTDEEVICTWMEPRPTMSEAMAEGLAFGWWGWWGRDRRPSRELTLDALWEVEERLADEQRKPYMAELMGDEDGCAWRSVHATAAQKIRALAAVIRSIAGAQAADATVGALPLP